MAARILLALSPSDIPLVLEAVGRLDMVTSHGLILVLPNPYQAPVVLDHLESLATGGNLSDVMDSVFVVAFNFPGNTSVPSETRRRRSVTELGYDVTPAVMSSQQSSMTREEQESRADVEPRFVSSVGKPVSKEVRGVIGSSKWLLKESGDATLPLKFSKQALLGKGGNDKRIFDSSRNPPSLREMLRRKGQLSVRDNQDGDIRQWVVEEHKPHQHHHHHHHHHHDYDSSQSLSSSTRSPHTIHRRAAANLDQSNSGAVSAAPPPDLMTDSELSQLLDSKDLLGLHDTVLALGYILDQQHSNPSLALPPVNFTADFQGAMGTVEVESNQRSFDAVVYDYEARSGFVERWYFNSTSPDTWQVTQAGSVVWPRGQVLGADDCFLLERSCEREGFDATVIVAIFSSIVGLALIVTVVVFFVKHYWAKNELTKGPNKIILSPDDLVFLLKKDMGKGSKLLKSRSNLLESRPDLLRGSDAHRSTGSINELSDFTQTARYNGDLVHVKELKVKNFEMKSKTYTFVRMLRDIRHENVNPYVGFLSDPERPAMVMEYCIRGSLKDMLQNEDIKLDWDFKLSLLTDLVRGLRYLHNCPLKIHGHLTSRNCVIDSRFVLKITDYGIPGFLEKMKTSRDLEATDLLWTAPEMLRDEALLQRGTEKGDVYSLSIIFQEVALRTEPYSSHSLTPEEIIKKVRKPPPLCRPSVSPQAAPPQFIQTMKQCWAEMPDMRPTVEEVYEQFKKLTGGKKANIVDTMFKMLEKYSNDLEDIVAERTEQLEEEKKKTDQLLFRMLPSTVAESLKSGRTVEAETFSEVTIYFSDIVGFTTISALSTPMQVVDLLNDLYTMFDATIERYDVYKVETIGDAYMVVSGLPLRNGNRHAGEVSTMALDLLSQCGHFTIQHMPHVPLRLRIGLHTGSCVAGVVGLTMPRYCLFGDTVNTASRMESTGAAFRIHISETCKNILDDLGGYHVDFRGETELKGKGIHKTWWLVGKEGVEFELPEPPPLHGTSRIPPFRRTLLVPPPDKTKAEEEQEEEKENQEQEKAEKVQTLAAWHRLLIGTTRWEEEEEGETPASTVAGGSLQTGTPLRALKDLVLGRGSHPPAEDSRLQSHRAAAGELGGGNGERGKGCEHGKGDRGGGGGAGDVQTHHQHHSMSSLPDGRATDMGVSNSGRKGGRGEEGGNSLTPVSEV
ncbi:retinal guanylyl cyclase 1-like [Babylonia areolata]|uniref:retinal guanylyl cyclase 1-like n=1 Tax=Babylonia areolata TaxID=304850 RepID=UPI003FD15F15